MVKYGCKYWLLFFICLFQAEYEIAPDEKLGEKGKEIMMKYLTPEVRGSQSGITEGMLQGTPLLNKVVTGFVSQIPKIYGGNLQWINLQVLHKQSGRKKIIMQSRNWLRRMNLTYQGLNSSVDEQRASLASSQCTKLCIGGVIQETSVVTNRCPSYFLSSPEVVVAFHILMCRKHRQKWSFMTDTVFWYRNSHSSPSPVLPRVGRDRQDWQGTVGLGAQRCCHPSCAHTVGPECCLWWLWGGEELLGAAVSTGWHSKQRHGCAAGIWDRLWDRPFWRGLQSFPDHISPLLHESLPVSSKHPASNTRAILGFFLSWFRKSNQRRTIAASTLLQKKYVWPSGELITFLADVFLEGLNGTICFGGAGAEQTTLFPLSHFPTINLDAYFQLSQAAFWDLVSFTEPG